MTKIFEINFNDVTQIAGNTPFACQELTCDHGEISALTCELPMVGRSKGHTHVTVKNSNGRLEATFGYAHGTKVESRVEIPKVFTQDYSDISDITVDFMIFTILSHDKFQKIADLAMTQV